MTILVAEIGINHNGSLDIAKKLIDVCAAAGMDYVKFQKRTIELVYTQDELDKPRESPWGTTTREQKQGLEFSLDQYKQIDLYCQDKDIGWFVSVWDSYSFETMYGEFDLPYVKVPSALIIDELLIEKIRLSSLLPYEIVLSTGMSNEAMIDNAVRICPPHYLLHCTSTYPSAPGEQNLSCIEMLKKKYPHIKIGFSNHFSGIPMVLAAYCLGAEMIEFHVTLDRSMYGTDQPASIEPAGIFRICDYIRTFEKAMGDGRKCIYRSELPVMEKLRRA
jgi:N-acetylneuraminate synthase